MCRVLDDLHKNIATNRYWFSANESKYELIINTNCLILKIHTHQKVVYEDSDTSGITPVFDMFIRAFHQRKESNT